MSENEDNNFNNGVCTRVLRNRTVLINETDPDLRVKVVEGWPSKSRGEKLSKMAEKTTEKTAEIIYKASQAEREEEFREGCREEIRSLQRELCRAREEADRERIRADQISSEAKSRMSEPIMQLEEALRKIGARDDCFGENKTIDRPIEGEIDQVKKTIERIRNPLAVVSDKLIGPKRFTGKIEDTDGEIWLETFERYCDHKQMGDADKRTLFPLMMTDAASDWFSSLAKETLMTYEALRDAFKQNYFTCDELKWKLTGNLWNQAQSHNERV
jgi:hypothetical protein